MGWSKKKQGRVKKTILGKFKKYWAQKAIQSDCHSRGILKHARHTRAKTRAQSK